MALSEKEKPTYEATIKYWKEVFEGPPVIDEKLALIGLKFVYENQPRRLPVPKLHVVSSEEAALKLAKELGFESDEFQFKMGLAQDVDWAAHYDFFRRLGYLNSIELDAYINIMVCGARTWLLSSKNAIAVKRVDPSATKRDAEERVHCENGPAAVFIDGTMLFFWHGIAVTEKIIMHPETITKEDIQKEENSEIVRIIAAKLGWTEFLKRLDVKIVDKWKDDVTGLSYELYDETKRRFELSPRYLKMQSPVLHDNTMPYYIESVDPNIKTAQAARKSQFNGLFCPHCKQELETKMYRHGDVQLMDFVVCSLCDTEGEPRQYTTEEVNKNPKLIFANEY